MREQTNLQNIEFIMIINQNIDGEQIYNNLQPYITLNFVIKY
jgi:microcystin-dependent protein